MMNKTKSTFIIFLTMLIIGVSVLWGCEYLTITPSTNRVADFKSPQARASQQTTSTGQSLVTKTVFTPNSTKDRPEDFSIVLYTNIVAGNYSVLHLSSSGESAFIKYGKVNQILTYKKGSISGERVKELYQSMIQKDFYLLESEYDIYPLPDDDTRVYEDIYYLIKVSNSDRADFTVVSHEKALPPNLEAIVNRINEIGQMLPEAPFKGTFLLAGDYEILRHKRPKKNEPSIQLTGSTIEEYPLLRESLQNPFLPINVKNFEGTRLSKVLSPNFGSIEVVWKDERFVVFLLNGD